MTPLEEIRRLYFAATRATIQRDLQRAIALLKQMASDDERAKAAVYMDGLSQMRAEWGGGKPKGVNAAGRTRRSRA